MADPGSSSTNQPVSPPSSSSSSTVAAFPPSLNLYLTSRLAILARSTFHLGPHRRSPLHGVTTHQGFSGAPDVVLHASPSSKSPFLATAEFETPFSEEVLLTFFVSPPENNNNNLRVTTMTSTARPAKDWGRRDWFYSVAEETGEDGENEEYVWRHGDGEEEDDDDDGRKGYESGWNLLRRRKMGKSGGEEEVVAFYAYPAMTMTKKMAFRFVERGGGEGKVEGGWAVAAVVSALGIWELERRRVAATGSMMGVA
ncbi:hypothetical protein GE09DRAFT_1192664 [Coniochaeta sp. 2T2.1]|nr:hypothetical protein GE09DRAFT_1192664 [Coniochaeta sp. 2T2.1]